ncbi:MAG: hypothetical protein IH588_18755 [Anaerolineales bacterium]|nr:hypothetical protein [Anaerolineales bacterium]
MNTYVLRRQPCQYVWSTAYSSKNRFGIGLLLAPIIIQEMVFAFWLIVKGFNQDAVNIR